MSAPTVDDARQANHVRLYISPFGPSLFENIIPLTIRPQVSNVSFHTTETNPGLGFGYVDLPTMEAQKLKNRLNGSTLKGAKMRVEDAKPENRRGTEESDVEDHKSARRKAKARKTKRAEGTIEGHELEEGRQVKRGWTERTRSKRAKSTGTTDGTTSQGEAFGDMALKFKTALPQKSDLDAQEPKRPKSKTKQSRTKGRKAVVVEEFSRSKKPNLGGDVLPRTTSSYVGGKGWVDEDGNVIEPEPPSRKRRRGMLASEEQAELPLEKDSILPSRHATTESTAGESIHKEDQFEPSDTDSSAEDDGDTMMPPGDVPRRAQMTPEAESAAIAKDVHPLEALFKRRAPTGGLSEPPKILAPIETGFRFLDDGEEDRTGLPPQTPHTRRDLEWRSVRSAAPTPDTAAIGKRFNRMFSPDNEDQGDENGDEIALHADDADSREPGQNQTEESEFRKWFYDNRGDLNRGWKKRRREERKLDRQRESRRLSRKLA